MYHTYSVTLPPKIPGQQRNFHQLTDLFAIFIFGRYYIRVPQSVIFLLLSITFDNIPATTKICPGHQKSYCIRMVGYA
jgi:hypothetical protein